MTPENGFTQTQAFWLELARLFAPILATLASAAAAYLIWLTRRDVRVNRRELQEVRGEVNGKVDRFIEQSKEAAFAAGTAHGVAAAAQSIVPPTIHLVVPPADAAPGGRRRTDPPGPTPDPTSPIS
jgi:hypothetical protein